MSNELRDSTTDENRPRSAATRWPVLARMPDVSAEVPQLLPATQTKIGTTNYRFDPPQTRNTNPQSGARPGSPQAIRNPQSTSSRQPHMFDRGRLSDRRTNVAQRQSAILPRSNPFAIPSKRLTDSLAPAIRFLTMVALFAAAGTWIQTMKRHPAPPERPLEPPRTAAQSAVAPAKNAADRPLPAPTAAGPLEQAPQTGARVGRVSGDGFSSLGPAAAPVQSTNQPTATPPHFLVPGGAMPQVQTSEPRPAAAGAEPARDGGSDETPAVASLPGFLIEIPVR